MSLFLGKIHFWLYDKILWYEGLEQEIEKWAQEKALPVNDWQTEIYLKYGNPTGGKPLENIIDTSNIHGWLQERISAAEARQSALVTKILEVNPDYINDLKDIFASMGQKAANELGLKDLAPEDIYNAINNYILEGMPCDRVEMQVSSTQDEYVWKLTQCLHRRYWETNNGDVENFYILRGAWIKAFVQTINSGLSYERSMDNVHRIFRL
jgi:hypothetical protein